MEHREASGSTRGQSQHRHHPGGGGDSMGASCALLPVFKWVLLWKGAGVDSVRSQLFRAGAVMYTVPHHRDSAPLICSTNEVTFSKHFRFCGAYCLDSLVD